jgi:hypothetical protein
MSNAPALTALPFNWGAGLEEMALDWACDAHLAVPEACYWRAVDVRAPVETVFRWLCQLKVAPYSCDWIDNFGRISPPTLTPGAEALAVGQRVMTIFRLVDFTAPEQLTLVMKSAWGRRCFGDVALTYRALRRGDCRSRLVVKLLVRYPRGYLGRLVARLLPWGDWLMMRQQLLNLKRLAERTARAAK